MLKPLALSLALAVSPAHAAWQAVTAPSVWQDAPPEQGAMAAAIGAADAQGPYIIMRCTWAGQIELGIDWPSGQMVEANAAARWQIDAAPAQLVTLSTAPAPHGSRTVIAASGKLLAAMAKAPQSAVLQIGTERGWLARFPLAGFAEQRDKLACD